MGEKAAATTPSALQKRNIFVDYRGIKLSLPVKHWQDELHYKLAAGLKGQASGGPQLQHFILEPIMFQHAEPVKLPESMVTPWQTCRRMACDIFQEMNTLPNCRLVLDQWQRKLEHFLEVDATFLVEVKCMEHLKLNGHTFLQDRLLNALPTSTRSLDIQHVLQDLKEFSGQELCRVVAESSRTDVDLVIGIVSDISAGICPKMALGEPASQFIKNVLARLAHDMHKCRTTPSQRTKQT